ncbi:unnamed protein product [Paramecium octaurelia]|uniref:Tetratricopeptide repeat protein n=1 Tax=Paramecium octaurelia TaxID=43137 RepID=A0A8S1TYX1_PAROT|nr:unnamed protein product [Paramecium octaurelia]
MKQSFVRYSIPNKSKTLRFIMVQRYDYNFYLADSLRLLEQYNEAIIWRFRFCNQIQIIIFHYIAKLIVQGCLINLVMQSFQWMKGQKQIQIIVIYNPQKRKLKSISLRQFKMLEEAKKVIEQSIQIILTHYQQKVRLFLLIGWFLKDQNQYEGAQIFFEMAQNLRPNEYWIKKYIDVCQKVQKTE